MSDRLLQIASFANKRDNQPRQQQPITVEELARRLTRHRIRPEKDGELWSPTLYRPGTARGKENVLCVSCLSRDVDRALEPPAKPDWPWYTIRHSTYSNQPELFCYRDTLPLSADVAAEDWPEFWERANHSLFRGQLDPACKDCSRIYYLPAHPPGAEGHFAQVFTGPLLDPARLPEVPQPTPRPRVAVPWRSDERPEARRILDYGMDLVRSGQGRNHSAMLMFAQFRDNRYDEGEALSWAQHDFLPRLPDTDTRGKHDPFSFEELADVCRKAYGRHPRDPWTPPTPRPPHPAEDPVVAAQTPPPDRAPEQLRAEIPPDDPEPDGPEMPEEEPAGAARPAAEEPQRTWRTFTFDTMAEQGLEEPEFPVASLIREGVNLFMGKTGDGKTFWAIDVAIAIATGGKALGHRDVLQGDVLYLALEESRSEMFQRMLQLRDELQHADLSRLKIASAADEDWPVSSIPATLAAIEEWLVLHPAARLIVLDPLLGYLAMGASPQQFLQNEYNLIRNLRTVARRHKGVAILVNDHRSKAMLGNGREAMDTGVHSTGLIASVDNRMTLVKEEGLRFRLEVKGRMVPKQELAHRFDPATGGWEVLEDVKMIRQSDVAILLLRELERIYPEPRHTQQLADALSIPHGTVKGRLFRMERAQSVLHVGPGLYQANGPGELWREANEG